MQHMGCQEQRREISALGLRGGEIQAFLLVAQRRVTLCCGQVSWKILGANEFRTLAHRRIQLVRHVGKEFVHLRCLGNQGLPTLQANQDIAANLQLASAVYPLANRIGRLGLNTRLDHDGDAQAQLVLGERCDGPLEGEHLVCNLLGMVDLAHVQRVLLRNADIRALRAAGPVRVPRGHLRVAAVEAAEHLLDGLLVVVVLHKGLLLLAGELQRRGQYGVVVVGAVLAVGRIDDQSVEALRLRLA
mmetsp:Transcript_33947/g.86048  ORF Transcript_33947/g.86048 Transcript_33947/m.86048 type:complete len:245 (-) Transcript_33947:883-1617(-)